MRSPISLQPRPAKMKEWLKRIAPLPRGSSRAVSPFCRSALHPVGETTAWAVQLAELGCRSRKFARVATLHLGQWQWSRRGMNMRPGTQRCYDLGCSGGGWGCKKCDKVRFHARYRHLEPYKRGSRRFAQGAFLDGRTTTTSAIMMRPRILGGGYVLVSLGLARNQTILFGDFFNSASIRSFATCVFPLPVDMNIILFPFRLSSNISI
jgi:hypothetical protein